MLVRSTPGVEAGVANNRILQRTLFNLMPWLRLRMVGIVIAGMAGAVLLVAQTLLLSWVVRDVLFRHAALQHALPLLVLTATAMGLRAGCVAVREAVSRNSAIVAKEELRQRLAAHVLALGPAYLTGERTGELVAIATEGIEKLDPYISRYLPQTILGLGIPLLIALAILPVDPLSAGLLLFTVPVIIMLMILIGTFTRDHVRRQWETLGHLSVALLDSIQGLPTLLLLDRTEGERRRMHGLSLQFRDRTLSVLKVAFLSGAVLELMTAAGIGLIATVLGVRLLDGGIAFDRAFFVFLLTPEFYRPLRDLGTSRHAALEGGAAAAHLLSLLETPPHSLQAIGRPVCETEPSILPAYAPVEVVFQDVSYSYDGRAVPALSQVTLTLPAGTSTALVGHSGSGKSTMINMLLGEIRPAEGTITVNGVPLDRLPLDAWRERIAFVPQRPTLFRGTILDNIRLASPDAEMDEVGRAAELAGCMPFIGELADGLYTTIGESGEGLSAGQQQRLAIARAFLKDAPLLVLDEPTSALDPESEACIHHALSLLMQGRTTLIVAHRLNTIRAADRIAVLDHGRLVESGSHRELAEQGGAYTRLLGKQQAGVLSA